MKSTIHRDAKQQLRAWSPCLPTCLNSVIPYSCRTFSPQHYNDQVTEKMKWGRKNCSGMCQLQQIGLCRPGWYHAKMLAAAWLHQPGSWVCHTGLSTAPGTHAASDSLPGLVSSSWDLCCDTIMHWKCLNSWSSLSWKDFLRVKFGKNSQCLPVFLVHWICFAACRTLGFSASRR